MNLVNPSEAAKLQLSAAPACLAKQEERWGQHPQKADRQSIYVLISTTIILIEHVHLFLLKTNVEQLEHSLPCLAP